MVGIGSVGAAIAYACLIRGSAGALALYDINANKVHAEVLDLNHGSQFVPHCLVSGSDDIAVTANSAIVIVSAGAKQHPGQSRLELAATNVVMVQALTPRLLEQSPDAIIVFVANPVDVVTYAAASVIQAAPGRIFGSGTILDSSRFRYLIAQRAGLSGRQRARRYRGRTRRLRNTAVVNGFYRRCPGRPLSLGRHAGVR